MVLRILLFSFSVFLSSCFSSAISPRRISGLVSVPVTGVPHTRILVPLITSMEGGDFLLCHTLTATDMRIERYDPTLRMRWSTLFQLSSEGPVLGYVEPRHEPLEEERQSIVAGFTPHEAVFPPFHAGNYIALVSVVHDTILDSTCAIARFFDRETGKMMSTKILHRAQEQKYHNDHGYRIALSPDSSKFLIARTWRGPSISSSNLDVIVISAGIDPQEIRLRTLPLNFSALEFREVSMNSSGDIIVTRQVNSSSVVLHKFEAPDYSSSSEVAFVLPQPEGSNRGLGFFKILPVNDDRAVLLSGEHNRKRLNRVNFITFNFRDSSSGLRGYTEFSPEIFEQIIDEEEFKDAMLHSVFASPNQDRYIAIFEQRAETEVYYTKYNANMHGIPYSKPSNMCGNILLVGFNASGDSTWVRTVNRKLYLPDPDYVGLSFNAAISPRNTLQLIYRGPGNVALNEFRLSDGESMNGPGTRFLLETGSTAFFYRPSVTWMKDGAVVMLFNHGFFSQEINAYRLVWSDDSD